MNIVWGGGGGEKNVTELTKNKWAGPTQVCPSKIEAIKDRQCVLQ